MTLIVLVATGFVACTFYVYVLWQWMRDANGKRTPPPAMDNTRNGAKENKPYIVGSAEVAEKREGSGIRPHRASRMKGTGRFRVHALSRTESERMACQKIASSLSLRKRS
jgi:hypothetical protein